MKKRVQDDSDKPVMEHLAELRRRLIVTGSSVCLLTIILYVKALLIIDFLKLPIKTYQMELAFFDMTGAFTLRLKLAFLASIVISFPLIIYQAIAFISPGLRDKEYNLIRKALFSTIPLFLTGAAFGYFLIVPPVSKVLITFGTSYMSAALSGEDYLSFIAMLCVMSGIIFTIPAVLIFLGKLGILSSSFLKKARAFIVFSVLIGEGMIVGDITSFILLAVPLIIVYEVSLWMVKRIEKRRAESAI